MSPLYTYFRLIGHFIFLLLIFPFEPLLHFYLFRIDHLHFSPLMVDSISLHLSFFTNQSRICHKRVKLAVLNRHHKMYFALYGNVSLVSCSQKGDAKNTTIECKQKHTGSAVYVTWHMYNNKYHAWWYIYIYRFNPYLLLPRGQRPDRWIRGNSSIGDA